MKPNRLRVRLDPESGSMFLVEERYRQAPRILKDMTSDILAAFAADLIAVDGTKRMERELKFPDGETFRFIVEEM